MSNSFPLVTVIVPIYKVEPYLAQCVESILNQSYSNLEIILVDDGSPDECGAIADEFEKMDPRVVSLHKDNGGLSDARNYGLRHATGEWISFVDSDDYISPVFIQLLIEAVLTTGCKIAFVPGGKAFIDGSHCSLADDAETIKKPFVIDARDAQESILYQEYATGTQWRLYHRSILGSDPFQVGIYFEDLASTYRFIHKVESVAIIDCRELYAYRVRSTSIIRQSYSSIKTESALLVSQQLSREICEWYPGLTSAAASRCFSVCRMVFAQIPNGRIATKSTESDRDALWKVLSQYKGVVISDSNARKRERLAAAIAFLGKGPFTHFCNICRRVGMMR